MSKMLSSRTFTPASLMVVSIAAGAEFWTWKSKTPGGVGGVVAPSLATT